MWYPIQSKYGAGIADTDIDLDDRNKVSIPSHYYQSDTNTNIGIDAIDFWINLLTSTTHMLHTDLGYKCLVGPSQLVLISRLFY